MVSVLPRALHTIYADESDDKQRFVMAFVSIPTVSLHAAPDTPRVSGLKDDWKSNFEQAKAWRAYLREKYGIPATKELKGSKLATGRNRYAGGHSPIFGRKAVAAYADALEKLAFLPDRSVFSVYATRDFKMYGYRKLEASLYAAFQRIQKQNQAEARVSQIFFDEGHAEYRKLFRKACVHLPTGSSRGEWERGQRSRNYPLTTTIKDANFKDSKGAIFIQIADLIAYATLLKARGEANALSEKERNLSLATLHDHIPRNVLNTRVVINGTDGIVRLNRNGP